MPLPEEEEEEEDARLGAGAGREGEEEEKDGVGLIAGGEAKGEEDEVVLLLVVMVAVVAGVGMKALSDFGSPRGPRAGSVAASPKEAKLGAVVWAMTDSSPSSLTKPHRLKSILPRTRRAFLRSAPFFS